MWVLMSMGKESCPSKYIIDVSESWWFTPFSEWCEKKKTNQLFSNANLDHFVLVTLKTLTTSFSQFHQFLMSSHFLWLLACVQFYFFFSLVTNTCNSISVGKEQNSVFPSHPGKVGGNVENRKASHSWLFCQLASKDPIGRSMGHIHTEVCCPVCAWLSSRDTGTGVETFGWVCFKWNHLLINI